ncbi:MAG: hypothetical protein R2708_18570 [Vicinamibacterales bacterium]
MTLFGWSAAWFVVLSFDQFIDMATGSSRRGWLDTAQLVLVFGFPPLIMHTMYREAHVPEWTGAPKAWATRVLVASYGLAAAALAAVAALITGLWRLAGADTAIGVVIALFFGGAGVYSSLVMNRNPACPTTHEGRQLRRVLNSLFIVLTLMNLLPALTTNVSLSFGTLGKLMSVTPLLFLSATDLLREPLRVLRPAGEARRHAARDAGGHGRLLRGGAALARPAAAGFLAPVALRAGRRPADDGGAAAVAGGESAPRPRLVRAPLHAVTAVTSVLASLQSATDEAHHRGRRTQPEGRARRHRPPHDRRGGASQRAGRLPGRRQRRRPEPLGGGAGRAG